MQKYKSKLMEKIRNQLSVWLNQSETVSTGELYKFLHSLAGTAPTIGLDRIGESARRLMQNLDEDEKESWTKEKLQDFLSELLTILFEENFLKSDPPALSADNQKLDKQLVMLIDDDTTLLMYIKDELEKENFAVMAFAEPERAIASFFDLEPDCVIIDVHMNNKSGLDVLVELKNLMKKRFVPTIMISVDTTKETRMKSYMLGADDFIRKPFDMDEFTIRVKRQVEKKKNIDELVMIDELTRVFNRKYLRSSFERIKNHSMREKQPFCLAVIDLDHFKKVNDTHGHLIGDEVLVDFAELLKNSIRASDMPFRYGGEEFLVLFPRADVQETEQILKRILADFSKRIFSSGNTSFSCTFSAGIAQYNKEENYLVLLNKADSALYEAKNAGRSRISAAKSNTGSHKKTLHVGIVDDDPIIRTILQDLFQKTSMSERIHFDIRLFRDGEEFLESDWYTDSQEEPYFMILDGVLPGIDGIDVLKKIRELKSQEQYTVIMLTSRKSEKDIAKALHLGADDYLTKPFQLIELESRLGHLIKRVK